MPKRATVTKREFQTINALIVLMELDERYVYMDAEEMSAEAGEPITEAMMEEARSWVTRMA